MVCALLFTDDGHEEIIEVFQLFLQMGVASIKNSRKGSYIHHK